MDKDKSKNIQVNKENVAQGNPLGSAPIGTLLKQFAIPSIVAMMVGAVYNLVDQFFIGQRENKFDAFG